MDLCTYRLVHTCAPTTDLFTLRTTDKRLSHTGFNHTGGSLPPDLPEPPHTFHLPPRPPRPSASKAEPAAGGGEHSSAAEAPSPVSLSPPHPATPHPRPRSECEQPPLPAPTASPTGFVCKTKVDLATLRQTVSALLLNRRTRRTQALLRARASHPVSGAPPVSSTLASDAQLVSESRLKECEHCAMYRQMKACYMHATHSLFNILVYSYLSSTTRFV